MMRTHSTELSDIDGPAAAGADTAALGALGPLDLPRPTREDSGLHVDTRHVPVDVGEDPDAALDESSGHTLAPSEKKGRASIRRAPSIVGVSVGELRVSRLSVGELRNTAERIGPSRSAKALMRAWHIVTFVFWALLFYAVWVAATWRNRPLVEDGYSYDVAHGITLSLYGCDVLLRPDDEPSLHLFLVRGRSVREFTTLDGSSSSSVLRQMKVHSLQGCAQLPGANCSRRCRVTVGIPPSASSASSASVTVFQHAFDTGSYPRVVVSSGVQLGSLTANGPSLSVVLQPNCTVGSLASKLIAGAVESTPPSEAEVGASLGSVSVKALGAGSVYLLQLPSTNTSSRLTCRRPLAVGQ